jgi:hypothetical protein
MPARWQTSASALEQGRQEDEAGHRVSNLRGRGEDSNSLMDIALRAPAFSSEKSDCHYFRKKVDPGSSPG